MTKNTPKLPDYSSEIESIQIRQEAEKAAQKLAKIPEDIIETLQDSIKKLMKIIGGWEDSGNNEYDPSKIIDSIKGMLDPVVSALDSLPVPKIPGLSDIKDLLSALSEAKQELPEKPSKARPEIPTSIISLLQDLLSALQSLCATLPLVLINLIFECLNVIIGMFEQIKNAIGVPPIPPPLDAVPKAISALPDIMKLILNLPVQLKVAIDATIKKQIKAIQDMSVPDVPTDINIQPVPDMPDISNKISDNKSDL